jgi:hypothetical protein
MKLRWIALFGLLAFFAQPALAQKLKVEQGNTNLLNGVSKMNISYDYSDMSVGKFKTEAEYITKKKEEYNKKEAGKGDKWEADWKADRTERYAPQFEELFNKYSKIQVGDYPSERYTLIVKTTRTEPGYNIHISRKNAEIDGEVWLVETANPSVPLLKISFKKAVGRSFGGYDYDTGFRIQEAYADLGKALGKYLSKL